MLFHCCKLKGKGKLNRRNVPLEGNNSPVTGAGGPAGVLNATPGIRQMAEPRLTIDGRCWPPASRLDTGVLCLCWVQSIICVSAVPLKPHLWWKSLALELEGDTGPSPGSFITSGLISPGSRRPFQARTYLGYQPPLLSHSRPPSASVKPNDSLMFGPWVQGLVAVVYWGVKGGETPGSNYEKKQSLGRWFSHFAIKGNTWNQGDCTDLCCPSITIITF